MATAIVPPSRRLFAPCLFRYETSECIDNLTGNSDRPELDFCFVGPGDLAMSCGLHTRDAVLGMMKAVEMQWMHRGRLERGPLPAAARPTDWLARPAQAERPPACNPRRAAAASSPQVP